MTRRSIDYSEENEKDKEFCRRTINNFMTFLSESERNQIKDASDDYKLVFMAKKFAPEQQDQTNSNYDKVINVFLTKYKALRNKQKNTFIYKVCNASRFAKTVDFEVRDKEALWCALRNVDLTKIKKTPAEYTFFYQYNSYLSNSNRKELTAVKKQEMETAQCNDTMISDSHISQTGNDTETRQALDDMAERKILSRRLHKLYYLTRKVDSFPMEYEEELMKKGQYEIRRKTMTEAEIAGILGCSESTVCRDLKKLDVIIAQLDDNNSTPSDSSDEDQLEELTSKKEQIESNLKNNELTKTKRTRLTKARNALNEKIMVLERTIKIIELHKKGLKNKEIEKKLKLSKTIVSRALQKYKKVAQENAQK